MSDVVSAKDKERAAFVFSVYDFEAKDEIDCFNLGDALRALGLLHSNSVFEKHGGTKKKGEKKMKFPEFLAAFATVKKDKDVGNIHDFMELMKLYDKETNGQMLLAELTHLLQTMGEVMTKADAEDIVKDCAGDVDDEGYFVYQKFLKTLDAGPFPGQED